ncbi:hypothetical protein AGMMS4956_14780 [Bacteroidia bacterium]|nr:hypothetical protein AGMMS4956_14780 [Bacteroidia bacterium]
MNYRYDIFKVGALFVLLGFCSCNKTEKLLKNPDFAFKYKEANRFYEKQKFDKAALLYENVHPFYRNSNKDDTITVQLARCYYQQRNYEMAEYHFGYIQQRFPRSPFVEEADYRIAQCSYHRVQRAQLDQSNTMQAIQRLEYYLSRYPNSEYSFECEEQREKLETQIAYKAYLNAKLYYQMEQYKAAVVSLKNGLKQYPNSPYREELLFLIFKSSYLHAKNSVHSKQQDRYQSSVDEYLNLISEYPASQYKKEAEQIYANVVSQLARFN